MRGAGEERAGAHGRHRTHRALRQRQNHPRPRPRRPPHPDPRARHPRRPTALHQTPCAVAMLYQSPRQAVSPRWTLARVIAEPLHRRRHRNRSREGPHPCRVGGGDRDICLFEAEWCPSVNLASWINPGAPVPTDVPRLPAGHVTAQRLNHDEATALMRSAGLEPLEPFPGVDRPWRCRHARCGHEVSPTGSRSSHMFQQNCRPLRPDEPCHDLGAGAAAGAAYRPAGKSARCP